MAEIGELAGVKEVAMFGKGLHVRGGRRRARGGRGAGNGWRMKAIAAERIEKITPSLEDVFVSLIEARDRAEQPQQEVQR